MMVDLRDAIAANDSGRGVVSVPTAAQCNLTRGCDQEHDSGSAQGGLE